MPDDANDTKPPLGLPEGSVRAVLVVILVGAICLMCVLGRAVPDRLWGFGELALGFYFVARAVEAAKR